MANEGGSGFEPRQLGRTKMMVGPLGISASYGVSAAGVERAFEAGVNYVYWGTLRTAAFAEAIRHLAPERDRMVLVVQSYHRVASGITRSVERALRKLGTDYADVLLLGFRNKPISPRIRAACQALRERGLVRHIALSTHNRPLVAQSARDADIEIFHLRYNAVHTGAERDVFPHLPAENPPGIVSFTATSWKQLLNPRRVPPGERVPTASDCYRFVLSNPAVDVCLTGPKTREHVEEAIRALERGPMSQEEIAWMRRVGQAIYRK